MLIGSCGLQDCRDAAKVHRAGSRMTNGAVTGGHQAWLIRVPESRPRQACPHAASTPVECRSPKVRERTPTLTTGRLCRCSRRRQDGTFAASLNSDSNAVLYWVSADKQNYAAMVRSSSARPGSFPRSRFPRHPGATQWSHQPRDERSNSIGARQVGHGSARRAFSTRL